MRQAGLQIPDAGLGQPISSTFLVCNSKVILLSCGRIFQKRVTDSWSTTEQRREYGAGGREGLSEVAAVDEVDDVDDHFFLGPEAGFGAEFSLFWPVDALRDPNIFLSYLARSVSSDRTCVGVDGKDDLRLRWQKHS